MVIETIKLKNTITFRQFKKNFIDFFNVKKIHDIRFKDGFVFIKYEAA